MVICLERENAEGAVMIMMFVMLFLALSVGRRYVGNLEEPLPCSSKMLVVSFTVRCGIIRGRRSVGT